jgi:hypothetical protein
MAPILAQAQASGSGSGSGERQREVKGQGGREGWTVRERLTQTPRRWDGRQYIWQLQPRESAGTRRFVVSSLRGEEEEKNRVPSIPGKSTLVVQVLISSVEPPDPGYSNFHGGVTQRAPIYAPRQQSTCPSWEAIVPTGNPCLERGEFLGLGLLLVMVGVMHQSVLYSWISLNMGG